LVTSPNVIPSSIVLNLAPQEVPPPIQDEHGDVMEDNEWAHEGSKWSCKVDACTNFYVAKWLFCKHLERTHSLRLEIGRLRHPYTYLAGPRQ
jgi:hypothetical protein